MLRIPILLALMVPVGIVGQLAMSRWTQWTVETKASVWVAVGTLLLAVATAWSVWETKMVLRGEERRHQQSQAPLLVVLDNPNRDETYTRGFTIRNRGTGIALHPRLMIRGTVTISKLKLPPGNRFFSTTQEQQAFNEKHTVVEYHDFESTKAWSASYANGWDTFDEEILANPDGSIDDIAYSRCKVIYYDMFGNQYETRYTDNHLDRFEWVQPQSLQPSR